VTRHDPRSRDPETLLVLSEDDIEDILGDAFVDIRERVEDDATAAECVEIVHERLTDPWYYTTHE